MSADNQTVFVVLFFVSYVLPGFWVAFDAARNRIPTDSKPYANINGAIAWFLLCVLFPMLGLVFYLVRRTLLLDERRRAQGVTL